MNNELSIKLQDTVNTIYNIYNNLHTLSNDALRDRVYALENRIKNSENKIEILNELLPDTFAIVKETAKRFTLGEVVVHANAYDKYLADLYDFVKIDGDVAIYKNVWDAGGQPFKWNMVHYDEQLKGGILLHYGYAVEMATGEGKTLVATLPVFLNALSHEGVHLMTVNDYLSKRDFELTRPIYMFYGLTADCIEIYSRSDRRKKEAYKADITFGTNSSFTFDYLFDHLALSPDEVVQQNHHFAVIDELDSILIDDADNPHIVGGGITYDVSQDYKDNIEVIRELVNDKELYTTQLLEQSASFTSKGKEWLCNKTGIKDLYIEDKTYKIKDFKAFPEDKQKEIYRNIELQNVFYQLLLALTVYERDVDYIVESGKIKIIDSHTGRVREGSRWEHGLHTAIEIKEKVKPEKDSDSMAVISLKNYFKLYDKICGMSGTIMPVADELSEIYELKCANLPPHKKCIRQDYPLQIYKTKQEKYCAIAKRILENQKKGRPTLVGSVTVKRAEAIGEFLSEYGIKYNRLDAKTTKEEAFTVAKAGIGNTVTVSTSVAGRGTDIKPSNDALSNGGLEVIGTDLFESVRIDRQLKGRTGRQGNPGTSIFFVSFEDTILKNLNDNDKAELETIKNTDFSSLDMDKISILFSKAQEERDSYFKTVRKATALKDDIVNPHRQKFYNTRNSVLFDARIADTIIRDILADSTHSSDEVQNHLLELYKKVKELILRSTWNNKKREKIFIPFSDDLHTFAILLDVKLIPSSFEAFCQEYKRQIILQVYDKQWKKFILRLMNRLDANEINLLDKQYDEMMSDINNVLISRLVNATIPFEENHNKSIYDNDSSDETIIHVSKHIIIAPDDLCPCKSGKKYCECHGQIQNQRKSRRK